MPGRPQRPPFTWLLLAAGLALACACEEEPTQAFGEPCSADGQCKQGLCVGGVRGKEPVCTRSCSGGDECPVGWACTGVTQDNVLVCSHGPATPFGGGSAGGKPTPPKSAGSGQER
jgi:hypothetical protein